MAPRGTALWSLLLLGLSGVVGSAPPVVGAIRSSSSSTRSSTFCCSAFMVVHAFRSRKSGGLRRCAVGDLVAGVAVALAVRAAALCGLGRRAVGDLVAGVPIALAERARGDALLELLECK